MLHKRQWRGLARSGANNSDIIDTIWIDGPDRKPRQRASWSSPGLRRICPRRTQNNRQLSWINVEAFDQRLGRRVGFGIEQIAGADRCGVESLEAAVRFAVFGPDQG